MKRLIAVPMLFAVAAAGVVSWHGTSVAQSTKPGETVHVFESAQGKVEFSHVKHREIFGQEKLDCKPCHMSKPPLFSMKKLKEGETRPTVTMAEMEQGKSCGGCHDGKTVINGKTAFGVASKESCSRCHVK